jgi:hypothetical protein
MHFDPTYAFASPNQLSDLSKLLIAGLVGFLAGMLGILIGEPIKQTLAEALIKRKLHRILREELTGIYSKLTTIQAQREREYAPSLQRHFENRFINLRPYAFDYYFENQREHVFLIHYWSSLKIAYEKMKALQDSVKETPLTDKILDAALYEVGTEVNRSNFP